MEIEPESDDSNICLSMLGKRKSNNDMASPAPPTKRVLSPGQLSLSTDDDTPPLPPLHPLPPLNMSPSSSPHFAPLPVLAAVTESVQGFESIEDVPINECVTGCGSGVTAMNHHNESILLCDDVAAPSLHIIHEPPLNTLNMIANNSACKPAELEWLAEDLKQEIAQWKPSITNNSSSDIAVEGGKIINVKRLHDAFASVFRADRQFYNFYQAHALAQELANMWGFHMKIEGGLNLVCTYGGTDRSNEYQSSVIESKRRNRSMPLSACGCQFKMAFRHLASTEQKEAVRTKVMKHYDKKVTIVQVRGNKCCFTHNDHSLDKASLIVAKKTSGAYSMKKMPIGLMETLVTMVAFSSGPGESRQIRSIMRQFVPEDLQITDKDVANFRNGARKAYLSGDINLAITNAGGNMSKFGGLDGESSIKLGSNEATKRAREILLSTMQNGGDTWIVLQYFKNLQSTDPSLVYEVCTDNDGRPIGIWWMTGEMLKAWIRYGDTLYLDSMKRQMNEFHWPYIGPVVLTSEMTVQVVCECIIIEESLPAYAFTLNNLFKHGCRRPKESLRIIFGDCLLTETLLELVGLQESSTSIFWDHFHLMSFVWPTALGKDLYSRISPDAVRMMNAQSATDFATACEAIKRILISFPEKYTYFKEGYMDHPEKFAAYIIDAVPLSLCRRGDSPAESNHSSINKRLGGGGPRQLTDQVHLLLERQHEIVTARLNGNTKYNHTSTVLSRQMKNDPSGREAMVTLSEHAYALWSDERLRAKEYLCEQLDDGSMKIVWPASGSCHIIGFCGRCSCTTRIAMGIQCRHELCMLGGKFIKEWFADRHFQDHILPQQYYDVPAHDMNNNGTLQAEISTSTTITPTSFDGGITFSFANEVCHDDINPRIDEFTDDINDISDPSGIGNFGVDFGCGDNRRGHYSTTKIPRVTFNTCLEQAKHLIQAASSDQDSLIALFSTFIKLTAVFRKGRSAAELEMSSHELVLAASLSMQPCQKKGISSIPLQAQPIAARSNTTTTTRGRIRAGVEGPRPTKKKTAACGFCGEDDGHNINGCTRRTCNGSRHHVLCGEEFNCVVSVLAQGTIAAPLPTELKSAKTILASIPPRTKWLVIKGVYHTLISANGIPPMDSTVIHVDCLGTGGEPLIEEEYSDCLVRMIGAHCWIGKSGKNGTKVLSSIFIDRKNPSLSESLLQKAQAL